jgi:hypothetical protein
VKKYFDKSSIWSKENDSVKGLPRPFTIFPRLLFYKNGERYVYEKTPIPYQSYPDINSDKPIGLIFKNEKDCLSNKLCPYCGLGFSEDQVCMRWITHESNNNSGEYVSNFNNSLVRVLSDIMPFHMPCMSEARKFCPFMRKLTDDDFEINRFDKLYSDAISYINTI